MAAVDVRQDGTMTDIRITAGSFGEGVATYDNGVFRFPNGDIRGVEDLSDLGLPTDPATEPHWSGDIVRGLQGALATTTKALPSPFGFAASFVGLGLDVLESSAHDHRDPADHVHRRRQRDDGRRQRHCGARPARP